MMWQSDNDFLNDMKNIDEFGSDFIHEDYYNPPVAPKSKITGPKRGLFVELEEEERELANAMKNTNITNDYVSVEKQIEYATGNIYSNDYLSKQWRPFEVPNKQKENNNGFVYKPKVNVKPLDPSNDHKVMNSLPKFSENDKVSKPKKLSVASAIEKSVLSTKNEKVEEKPVNEIPVKPKYRFALPISKGKTYYDEYPVSENELRTDCKWSSSSSWDNSSSITESSWSGMDSSSNFADVEFDDSLQSNRRKQYKKKNDILNIGSKTDFPPLS